MTSRLARVTIILAVGVLTVAVLATAQTKDPFVGTWRLNVAESKVQPRAGAQDRYQYIRGGGSGLQGFGEE